MSLTVSDSGKAFELCPPGVYDARCWMVADLGMETGGQYGPKSKIKISWEIPEARMGDGRCFSVTWKFTASMNPKAPLRHMLELWRGRAFTPEELKGFNVANLIGKPCMVQVQHVTKGDKTYANVVSVSPLRKGAVMPPQENESILFDLDSPGNFNSLPEWLQKQINLPSNDAPPMQGDGAPFDDDIPF